MFSAASFPTKLSETEVKEINDLIEPAVVVTNDSWGKNQTKYTRAFFALTFDSNYRELLFCETPTKKVDLKST